MVKLLPCNFVVMGSNSKNSFLQCRIRLRTQCGLTFLLDPTLTGASCTELFFFFAS